MSGAMVLGFDPGKRRHGWSLIDVTVPSAPVFFEHGNTERYESVFEMLPLRGFESLVRLVAVEQARAVFFAESNVDAMAVAWMGGEIAGYARALGYPVDRVGPHDWRHGLVGDYRRGDNVDRKVKSALSIIVRHYPQRSNTHERDAAGVALYAARDWRRLLQPRTA